MNQSMFAGVGNVYPRRTRTHSVRCHCRGPAGTVPERRIPVRQHIEQNRHSWPQLHRVDCGMTDYESHLKNHSAGKYR